VFRALFFFIFFFILIWSGFEFLTNNKTPSLTRVVLPIKQIETLNDVSCLATALEMALLSEGIKLSQTEIWKAGVEYFGHEPKHGLTTKFILDFLTQKNIELTFFKGTVDNLKNILKQKKTVIYYVAKSYLSHALLFIGFDDSLQVLYFFDPGLSGRWKIDYKDADNLFRESYYQALVLSKNIEFDINEKISTDLITLTSTNLNPEEKIKILKKIPVNTAEKPLYLRSYGNLLYEQGKYYEALEKILELQKEFGNTASIFDMIGNCHLNLKAPEKAIENYKKALNFSTVNITTYYNLIKTLLSTGQKESAKTYLQIAMQKDPSFTPFYHFQKKIFFDEEGIKDIKKYIIPYLEAIKNKNLFPFFKNQFIEDLKAIKALKDLSESEKQKAERHLQQLNTERVVLPVEQTMQDNPEEDGVSVILKMALQYENIDLNPNEILTHEQEYNSIFELLFDFFSKSGIKGTLFKGSIENLKIILGQNKPVIYHVTNHHLYNTLLFIGFDDELQVLYFFDPFLPGLQEINYAQAEQYFLDSFHTAVVINKKVDNKWKINPELLLLFARPSSPEEKRIELKSLPVNDAELPLILYNSGNILYQEQKYKLALETFLQLQKEYGNCFPVLNAIGNCFIKLNDLNKAIEFYKKAITHSIFNVFPYHNLINTLFLVGQVEQAKPYLQQALQMSPSFAPLYHFQMEIYFNEDTPEIVRKQHIESYLKAMKYAEMFPFFKDTFIADLQKIKSLPDLPKSSLNTVEIYLQKLNNN
jgi:tetratricopeptide (TPR) repeat protein